MVRRVKQHKQNLTDEKIESMLKSLPKIEDKQDMDQLYINVMQKFNEAKPFKQKKKKLWLGPLFAMAAVFLIGFIYTAYYVNDGKSGEIALDEIADNGDIVTENFVPSQEESIPSRSNDEPMAYATTFPYIYNDLVEKNDFFGLKLGMNYQEVIGLLGEPLTSEDFMSNLRQLKYTEEGFGIQLKFNMNDGSIVEYIFYPQYLNDTTKQTSGIFQLPITKAGILQMFGEDYQTSHVLCEDQSPNNCAEYIYTLDEKRQLTVRLDEAESNVVFIQYATTNFTEPME
jgi:hypothetical protein